MDQQFDSSPFVDASRQFLQAIRAECPPRVSARRHHQDCRDRHLRVPTAAAAKIITFAAGLEPDLRDRGRIVDQLDSNKI
jgi:hypothetical protein